MRINFLQYSLSRVVILDSRRIQKIGKENSALRNELNFLFRSGYKARVLKNSLAIKYLDELCSALEIPNWRSSTLVPSEYYDIQLFAAIVENSRGDVVAVSLAFASEDLANNFYYCGLESNSVRWLATESLIEATYGARVKYFRTDNLLDVSIGSYEFQEKMGYATSNLKFV
jgi:hypothetical protein